MGASESVPSATTVPARQQALPSGKVYGLRLCSMVKGSPAHLAGLEVFFDHIVEAGDSSYYYQKNAVELFAALVRSSVNETIKLLVYNTRFRVFRHIWVTPQQHPDYTEPTGSLGVAVTLNSNLVEDVHGLRVLTVYPDSPASEAGLIELTDTLMGSLETVFQTVDDFTEILRWRGTTSTYDTLHLIVYSIKLETVRTVELHPRSNWGGPGCCGLSLGCGLLYRLPPPRHIPKDFSSDYQPPALKSSLSVSPSRQADAATASWSPNPPAGEADAQPSHEVPVLTETASELADGSVPVGLPIQKRHSSSMFCVQTTHDYCPPGKSQQQQQQPSTDNEVTAFPVQPRAPEYLSQKVDLPSNETASPALSSHLTTTTSSCSPTVKGGVTERYHVTHPFAESPHYSSVPYQDELNANDLSAVAADLVGKEHLSSIPQKPRPGIVFLSTAERPPSS